MRDFFLVALSIALLLSMFQVSSKSSPDVMRGSVYITASEDLESDQTTVHYNPRNDIVLGKDRELFSFSIDVKWLLSSISNPKFWIDILRKISGKCNSFLQNSHDDFIASNNSMRILSGIRKLSKASIVKVFKGDLQQAQAYSILKSRFMVLYVEDSDDWSQNLICRKTLADNTVGNAMNDNFILYASSSQHSPTFKFAKLLGAKSFPYLAILHVPVPSRSGNVLKSSPEVLGTLNLGKDLRPDKVLRFLSKALEFHSKTLLEDRKLVEAHELLQQTLLDILERTVATSHSIQKENLIKSAQHNKKETISPGGTMSPVVAKKKEDAVLENSPSVPSASIATGVAAAATAKANVSMKK